MRESFYFMVVTFRFAFENLCVRKFQFPVWYVLIMGGLNVYM